MDLSLFVKSNTTNTRALCTAKYQPSFQMAIWSSSKYNSKYALRADHGNAYWEVRDGKRTSPTKSVKWGCGEKHDPEAPFPSAIYAALRAAPEHTLTLAHLLYVLKEVIPVHIGRTPEVVLCDYIRELNKQGILTMTDKGTF